MTDHSTIKNAQAPSRPIDYDVRQQALDPSGSYAVTAPAGSGKTALLTQRVLRLLSLCDNPEEILCITFTRKAAAEMHERIHHALQQAAQQTEPPCQENAKLTWQLARKALEQDKHHHWQLLDNPSRLRIQTIDGLCRSIAKQLPLTSGLGALPNTLDQPEQAYRQAVQELLKTLRSADENSDVIDSLCQLLAHLDNNLNTVEDLLVSMLARRDQWLPLVLQARHSEARDYFNFVLQRIIKEALSKVKIQLQPIASDLAMMIDYAAEQLLSEGISHAMTDLQGCTELPSTDVESLPHWQALTDILITRTSGTVLKRLTKNNGFPAGKSKDEKAICKLKKEQMQEILAFIAEQPELVVQLNDLRTLPSPELSAQQWQFLQELTTLLPHLLAHLTLTFKQLGATDFTEITRAALQALGDSDAPSDIALLLDHKIQHILVDEFQDTASPQLQLLEALTQGWEAGDGRSLFIVGDGMQSCYGFRDANVGIFLDARTHGIGQVPLEPLDLCVNFRSQAGVIDWVNDTFIDAYPVHNDIGRGAVSYSPSTAFNELLPLEAVTCYACEDDGSRDLETQQVIEIVQHTLAQRPDDSIALLVRNRPHLLHILNALEKAQIPWQATDIQPLSERMAIVDLMSLTRALLNYSDRLAWFSVLRAPWCGLTLDDLLVIARCDASGTQPQTITSSRWPILLNQLQHPAVVTAMSAAGQARIKRFLPALEQSLRYARRKSLRQTIEGLWLTLGGPATLTDSADLNNVDSFFALLDKHDQGASIDDWDAFEKAAGKLYAAPQSQKVPLQVMTIHKSKGLEFDTVIIPGLDRGQRADTQQLLLWLERLTPDGDRQLLLSGLSAKGNDQDPNYQYIAKEHSIKNQLEATRLLYVGCTRAIKQLHLLANVKIDGDDDKAPAKSTLLNSIWPSFRAQAKRLYVPVAAATNNFNTENSDHSEQPGQSLPPLNHFATLADSWQAIPAPHCDDLAPWRQQFGDTRLPNDEPENPLNRPELESSIQRRARLTGNVIHALLERYARRNEPLNGKPLTEQHSRWQALLRREGVAPQELDWALTKVTRAIQCTLQDPTGQWLLQLHENDACELAIQHRCGKQWQTSVIDRTFVDKGVRWVIDYKSAEPDEHTAWPDFIRQACDQYRPQLQRYRQCIQQLGEDQHPIRTALYFPLLPKFVEID